MINQLKIDNVSRNYLVVSSDMHQRYISIIEEISNFMNLPIENILSNPDIKYISLPIIDKSGKYIHSVSNNDLLLNHYGLVDKIDSHRIGSEISIEQIREVISFTQISAHKNKKIVILNDVAKLNKEASSALLKTLEEVSSNCSFILLCNSYTDVYETIRSRCQLINLDESKASLNYHNFQEYFYSNNIFLKNYSDEYNINNMLKKTTSEIESLLSKTADPIEISEKWHEVGAKLIIEILHNYIVFIVKNSISLNLEENKHNNNLKKLSNIYNEISSIKNNISLNINHKYILNNISIELAS